MKIPCEMVVNYVLPTIRRELASELVAVHGMSQADVARKFGVTDAAISQYLKRKRGGNDDIEKFPQYSELLEAVRTSAVAIATDNSDFVCEACRLCAVVKRIGLLDEIYKKYQGRSAPECGCHNSLVKQ